jgi:hypothetical protein
MVKRTTFNNILVELSNISPVILTLLIIILFIKGDQKAIIYLVIILILSYLFERYEKHHVIPIVAFYLFNTLQIWLDVLLDFIVEGSNYISTTIELI